MRCRPDDYPDPRRPWPDRGPRFNVVRAYEPSLSPRQRAILELAATGATYAEIAAALGCHRQTVKAQLAEAYDAFNARRLIGLLYVMGWITIPPRVVPPVPPTAMRFSAPPDVAS